MPQVTVNTYALLREYTDGRPSVVVQIAQGTTVRELLTQLGVPHQQVQILFVDHRAVTQDHVLQGDEQLDLFSAIGGG